MPKQTLICQVINSKLLQKIEVIKGLEQGSDLKATVLKYQELLEKAKAIHKSDSLRLIDKDKIIELYKATMKSKETRLVNTDIIHQSKTAILKDKLKNRFSIGLSGGLRFKNFTTFETDNYFGIGINFALIKF